MNRELIANLAKQALVAANGIAEICCETPEEVEYFWQRIVENAGSTKETVPTPIRECDHVFRTNTNNLRVKCVRCGFAA